MSEMCEACRAFNMSLSAFHSSPFEESRMHQLGWFFDVEKRTYCPLCSLLTTAFRSGSAQQQTTFEGSRVQGCWVKISEDEAVSDAGLQFFLVGKNQDLEVPLSVRLVPSEGEEPGLGAGRLIDPGSVQVPFIWLRSGFIGVRTRIPAVLFL